MSARPQHAPVNAWECWQRSKAALDDLNDLMQVFGTHVAQEGSIELPHHTVRGANRALARFQENFLAMVYEQRQKRAR
jgi:hypothetical protein